SSPHTPHSFIHSLQSFDLCTEQKVKLPLHPCTMSPKDALARPHWTGNAISVGLKLGGSDWDGLKRGLPRGSQRAAVKDSVTSAGEEMVPQPTWFRMNGVPDHSQTA
ncbi:hypothetical protein NQZ68_014378, partial [Dissostichus eleginoides]